MSKVHLVQMMPDERRVLAWGAERGFLRGDDVGYVLHGLLGACYGDAAPPVFAWLGAMKGHRAPHLLAYSGRSADELRQQAGFFGEPEAMAALGVEGMASKAMPTFTAGMRLGIEVVTRPVVRGGRDVGGKRKSFETDAYIHARTVARLDGRDPDAVDRDGVYRDWLEGRLAEQGVDVQDLRVVARRQTGVARRARPKEENASYLRAVQGQEVRYDGTVEVVDPQAFSVGLARGVGRHRSFGYGMLVLRPPGTQALAA